MKKIISLIIVFLFIQGITKAQIDSLHIENSDYYVYYIDSAANEEQSLSRLCYTFNNDTIKIFSVCSWDVPNMESGNDSICMEYGNFYGLLMGNVAVLDSLVPVEEYEDTLAEIEMVISDYYYREDTSATQQLFCRMCQISTPTIFINIMGFTLVDYKQQLSDKFQIITDLYKNQLDL